MMQKEVILSVRDLNVKFSLRGKVLHAIRGISLDLYKGESLAIVGESGSGKSVFTKNFIGLLDKNGWVDSGSILYKDMDLAKFKTEKDWIKIRGKEVAMVMQDPMTSLNPLKTVGWQIEEALELHQQLKGEAAKKKAIEILADVGIPEPARRYGQYPHEFSGGMRQRCVLAIALALLCARFEHSALDRLICRVGTTAYYVPAFWLGVLLVLVFSVNLEWLPSSGAYSYGKAGDIADRARHLVLPLAVMVASHLWYYAYMIRNKLLDEVRRDYVLLARSKGLGRTRVLWSHCLRNVMPTVVGIMAISIPHVLSGTYVAEAVFNYPGIGLLAISSAKYHDYNLLMLMVLFTGAMVISSSLLAQSINEAIDPRIKSGEVVC